MKLAGEDIYSFNNSEEPYNKTGENGRELNINTLEEKFGATLIEVEVDKDTGFAAYALRIIKQEKLLFRMLERKLEKTIIVM